MVLNLNLPNFLDKAVLPFFVLLNPRLCSCSSHYILSIFVFQLWKYLNEFLQQCHNTEEDNDLAELSPELFDQLPLDDLVHCARAFADCWNNLVSPLLRHELDQFRTSSNMRELTDPRDWIVATWPWNSMSELADIPMDLHPVINLSTTSATWYFEPTYLNLPHSSEHIHSLTSFLTRTQIDSDYLFTFPFSLSSRVCTKMQDSEGDKGSELSRPVQIIVMWFIGYLNHVVSSGFVFFHFISSHIRFEINKKILRFFQTNYLHVPLRGWYAKTYQL